MRPRVTNASRFLLPAIFGMLAIVLLYSSLRTFRELDMQRDVYLRNRVGTLAARLEGLPAPLTAETAWPVLSEEEPGLVDVAIVAPDSSGPDFLNRLRDGKLLFHTEYVTAGDGERLFRAWLPFHSSGGLRIVRLDLSAGAADFLLVHARHNVIVASVSGGFLILLALYAVWTMRRAAALERRHLEIEHLAHIGKMSAVLAHEIRNPLGTIKGFTQLAAERADPNLRGLLDPVLAETTRLESLVTDLLRYGRPPAPVARRTPWSRVSERLLPHARAAAPAVRIEIADAPLEFDTDADLLEQILLNLLRNAVEAGATVITLDVERSKSGGITVAVRDNGPGIPQAVRERLFEPFFTTKTLGTGLGLSIARKLASALGGTVDLQPREAGGTEALVRFPGARATSIQERTPAPWTPS